LNINDILAAVDGFLWANWVLYTVLGVGVLFTIWSAFSQYRALTHGTQVIRGRYDDPKDPGAINHFQALSTALSATVGLGNIGGVALAIALGGPGAVFWMWMVGLFGMALKTTEVTQSMLYRNTDDPDNPHGGPMWVVSRGLERWSPALKPLGIVIGGVFCITLIISTITGGNMFQAWNVAEITNGYFPAVPKQAVGIILAITVGLVIIGGIKRIGAVAGRLVPMMCGLYLLAALLVVAMNIGQVPAMLRMIFISAFAPTEAAGAFVGGTFGWAFLQGMKRALFSSEAGQGSAPVAHSAAKTDEPVREGIVAGLEPFIDTIVVCTLTTLVILLSGAWNRGAETFLPVEEVRIVSHEAEWTLETPPLPPRTDEAKRPHQITVGSGWRDGETVFMIVLAHGVDRTGHDLHRIMGTVHGSEEEGWSVEWGSLRSDVEPTLPEPDERGHGVFAEYVGAYLTGHAFDRVIPGLGMWLVTIACWLFAISTMIAWSYYGEQGVIFLVGQRFVLLYKFMFCVLIIVATMPLVTTVDELEMWAGIGTGVMLFANIPIMLIFGAEAMRAYKDYIRRLDSGEMEPPHDAPPITDVVSGEDVE
jgi:alanine or glycine:cation symporter, AGCS family